jgi:hypothetical protein
VSEPVLALDIGGMKIAAALVTGGHVGEVCRRHPARRGLRRWSPLRSLARKRGESRPVLVGIGSAG